MDYVSVNNLKIEVKLFESSILGQENDITEVKCISRSPVYYLVIAGAIIVYRLLLLLDKGAANQA